MISRSPHVSFSFLSTLPLLGVLLTTLPSIAGGPPLGVPSGVMPWDNSKWQNYRYVGPVTAPAVPAPAHEAVLRSPTQSTLMVTNLGKHNYEDKNAVFVVAHVPPEAQVFFFDHLNEEAGEIRTYRSSALEPGHDYSYTVRIRWIEEGEWVSQMTTFHVHAGDTHCINLIHTKSPGLEKQITTALAKLSPEDAEAAKKQRTCAVQDGVRLGSMGMPKKVMVKGEAIYLCCSACEEAIRKDEDKVLQTAKKLREKATPK